MQTYAGRSNLQTEANPVHIYIVIPVHNRKRFTQACLANLFAQNFRDFTVIVVDDGSTDGTSAMIQQEFPATVILSGDGNLWWTGATNLGVRHALELCAADDYILIINDDLTVAPDYLDALLSAARSHPHSLIGSVETLQTDPDRINRGGVLVNWATAKKRSLNQGQSLNAFPPGYLVQVDQLTGRGTLFPAAAFREGGLYDNAHFLQCGDTELPVRAHFKHSYSLFVAYDAVVVSYPGNPNHINSREHYKLGDAREYFLGVRSNFNLRYRFWYAYNIAPNPFWFLRYFLLDLLRITGHFVSRLQVVQN